MTSPPTTCRAPAVSGTFYPADPAQLEADLETYLAAAKSSGAKETPPKALIAPHAGYVYSGPIAGSAFTLLESCRGIITRVVLLGPSHFVPFEGIATCTVDAFTTPLGEIAIDREAVAHACKLPGVHQFDTAHAREHCLEVELPFLQKVLGSFSLVPFVIGEAGPEEVGDLIDLLWGGPETLIVVSSDLSHYYDYAHARKLDRAASAAIENLQPENISSRQACGRLAIQGLLLSARRHGLEARILDLRNSGDTAGSKDRVVGYGAWAFH